MLDGVARGADHRHRRRPEERAQRGRGGQPVQQLRAGDARLGGLNCEGELHITMFERLLHLKAGAMEDLQHGPIVPMGHRPKMRDPMADREQRQALQQQGSQALAVEGVVDRQGDLGHMVLLLLGEVGARGDDAWRPPGGAEDDEGELLARVGGVTQGIDPFAARDRRRKEPPLSRFWRQLLEKGAQGLAVIGLRHADQRGGAVAQDEASGLHRVLVRRGYKQRTHVCHGFALLWLPSVSRMDSITCWTGHETAAHGAP